MNGWGYGGDFMEAHDPMGTGINARDLRTMVFNMIFGKNTRNGDEGRVRE